MTKKDMIRQLAAKHNMSQVDIRNIVQGTFDAIIDAIASEGRIELRNFGVFEVKERKARKARNPKTGVEVYVPPKRVVTFKPGRLMEESIRSPEASAAAPRSSTESTSYGQPLVESPATQTTRNQ